MTDITHFDPYVPPPLYTATMPFSCHASRVKKYESKISSKNDASEAQKTAIPSVHVLLQ